MKANIQRKGMKQTFKPSSKIHKTVHSLLALGGSRTSTILPTQVDGGTA